MRLLTSILLFSLLCTCAPSARNVRQSVEEVNEKDRYRYTVQLGKGDAKELMRCTNEITDSRINLRMKGELSLNVDEKAELTVHTRNHFLEINHYDSDPVVRQRVLELVDRTRQCLDL